jgi:ABC-type transport system involved in cytochrome c biogenesis permease subunit
MVGTRFIGEPHPLPPALQSGYFAPHVVSYFIAYGALTVSGLASLVLVFAKTFSRTGSGPVVADAESWAWRSAQIGFPFLTLGLVLGAVWAQAAYTDYWAWDPKEVWALATWLLVSAWFMLRANDRRGWGTNLLMVVAVGAMYFTLFGDNFLPAAQQSLHAYTMK